MLWQGQHAVGRAIFKDREVNDPNWDVDVRIRKELIEELEQVTEHLKITDSCKN